MSARSSPGRDLPRARPGQLRQHDDVDSGRAHAGARARGVGGVVHRAAREDGASRCVCAASSPTACRARTCTSGASRSVPAAGVQARYNAEMGPPVFAPLLFGLVGGMGLLAAILRRASGDGGHARRPWSVRGLRRSRASPITGTTITRAVVFSRLATQGTRGLLHHDEEAVARALLDRLLAQDDEPKVPVLELIDARLVAARRRRLALRRHARRRRRLEALGHWRSTTRPPRRCRKRFVGTRPRGASKHLIEPVRTAPGTLARDARHARVRALDALRVDRVLLAPVGVERDRLRRAPRTRAATRTSASIGASRGSVARSIRATRFRGPQRSKPPERLTSDRTVASPERTPPRRPTDMRTSATGTRRRG